MAAESGLRIGVLGPLLATCDGKQLEVRGRVGILLATLALSAGHPVSVARLTELIWSDEQPEHSRASMHNLIARVRGVVPGVVVTVGDGYLLDLDPDCIDLLRFRRLVLAADGTSDSADACRLLDQALELWRGEPLSGLRSAALEWSVRPGLTDELLSATQKRADLELAAGNSDKVIAQLRNLTGQFPLREPLWVQLLRALSDAGRPAEAVREYHRARGIMAAQLGVDLSAELQGIYQQLLQADPQGTVARPSPAAVSEPSPSTPEDPSPGEPVVAFPSGHTQWVSSAPRQLPAGVAGFAGRAEALMLLSELADEAAGGPGGVVIAAISGMAGVGKTSLALHWAHYEAERFTDGQLSADLRRSDPSGDPASPAEVARGFPDGQLYADLRGFDPSNAPASPTEVICGFLDALGVPPERIPVGLEAQAGLYRTILAERHVLIVLDNARDAAQVVPLLPGSAGCMVVVTSRNPLTPLAARYGARLISLDVLTDDEAAELLSRRLGAGRMAADPETATELAALCGRLPLALAITAARAAARPGLPLAIFSAELRNARKVLDALDAGDPARNLRAVFSWSCQELSSQATDLLPLLSIHPGPDISLPAAASLAGSPMGQTGAAMRELAALNLVKEHRPGRYILHGLVRAYAAEQADATIPANQRRAAVGRVLDHYLHTAQVGDATLSPAYYPIDIAMTPAYDGTTPEDLGGREQAMDWFQAEHRVLIATAALAASTGFDSHAWQLPMAFFRYLDWHGLWDDWDAVLRTAHAVAQRLADQAAQASVLRSGGMLSMRHGSYPEAHRQFEESLHLSTALDDLIGQARAHGDLSMLFSIQDRYREALAHSERALELSAAAGHPHLHATSLNKVGWHAAHLGDYKRALAACEQALALQQDLGNRHSEAFVWDSLGYIHQHLQHHAQSVECFHRAVSLFGEIGNRFELAATLSNLGDARHAASQAAAARDAWQQALAILTELHHHDAIQLEAKLRCYNVDTAANGEKDAVAGSAC